MASSEATSLTDYSLAQVSGYEESGQSSLYSRTLRPDQREAEQALLPRADGGRRAWLFLAGCFMFKALIWVEKS